MISVPQQFRPKINTVYPPNNTIEYERWFYENYKGGVSDREYLGVYWCGYQVNANYGQDKRLMYDLQAYVDSLPENKRYFTISQYDNGVGVDWKGKDVLEFNMSKNIGVPIPLMCEPHPYPLLIKNKRFMFSFIGSRTHPIRDVIFEQKAKWELENDTTANPYVACSDQKHDIQDYCNILQSATFGLCPRGYGLNSFRVSECLQYGVIPIVISDEYVIPFGIDFNEYGVLVKSEDAHRILDIVLELFETPMEIIKRQDNIPHYYENYYTYQGCYNQIIKYLQNECL